MRSINMDIAFVERMMDGLKTALPESVLNASEFNREGLCRLSSGDHVKTRIICKLNDNSIGAIARSISTLLWDINARQAAYINHKIYHNLAVANMGHSKKALESLLMYLKILSIATLNNRFETFIEQIRVTETMDAAEIAKLLQPCRGVYYMDKVNESIGFLTLEEYKERKWSGS